jgi:hypothetical protein
MADQWEFCVVSVEYDQVSYYSPNAWEVKFPTYHFIETHYPGISKPDRKKTNFPYLINKLLIDGWEPFSVSGGSYAATDLSFRRKFNA